ncbi:MAG TPA: DUF5666 domain-containing protein [Vicinamibacteria bacterium]|nr:DUF5666 domain-containing protein [Vicinamibacteria bacterium]
MNRRASLTAALEALLILVSFGCDFNPTAPFSGFEGEDGATLTGRFQGTPSSGVTLGTSSLRAQTISAQSGFEGITAKVFDTNDQEIASVDVNADGTFTLRGLPEAFYLQFEGPDGPIGGPIYFDAVKPNQEIDIVLEMVGDAIVVVEERRTGIDHEGSEGVELEGRASSITPGENPMTGSLDVNGYTVLTRAGETSIRKGNRSLTLEDLQDGDRVHVRGVFEGQDVFAYEIKLQEELENDGGNTGGGCDYRDPAKPNHILVCHKGKTLSIAPDAWPGHRGHGDTCGPCGSSN